MFTAALFTIARTWKQPKCPSTEQWIRKIWYHIHNGILSNHNKGRNNAICSNMDRPRDFHVEWSTLHREIWNMILLICAKHAQVLLLDEMYAIEKEQSWMGERESGEQCPLGRKSLFFCENTECYDGTRACFTFSLLTASRWGKELHQ